MPLLGGNPSSSVGTEVPLIRVGSGLGIALPGSGFPPVVVKGMRLTTPLRADRSPSKDQFPPQFY